MDGREGLYSSLITEWRKDRDGDLLQGKDAAAGNSGGPWFYTFRADGIHSGWYETDDGVRNLFTP